MNLNEKMEFARKYNKSYRTGNELVSDPEYDILLSEIQKEMYDDIAGNIPFMEFTHSLMEETGDVKSNYVLGSLTKIKFEDHEDLYKWIKKENINSLFISEKLDGCSYEANYRYGEYVSCASKGDSIEGSDWTEKGRIILPQTIANKEPIFDIRGEFSLIGDTYKELGYKTRRAGTVGIMNRDEVSDEVKYIQAFAYQILSSDADITSQFYDLSDYGFIVPQYTIRQKEHMDSNLHEDLKSLYLNWKKVAMYEIDGIVISEIDWKNENDQFLPKKKVAFKVNSEGIETEVIGIEWEVSKGRLLKPVLLLSPIEIDGTTVQRATAYNAKYILDNEIDKGAIVSVIKSGCVIPKVVKIVKKADQCFMPITCPACGSELSWHGVERQCLNELCGEIKRVEYFIKQSGIENVSEKRLASWGINTFDDLLEWNADPNYNSQREFYNELLTNVFHKSPEQIMRNFSYDGMGKTIFDKYLKDVCGGNIEAFDHIIKYSNYRKYLTEGIGERTLEKMEDDWNKNWDILLEITSDSRYEYIKKEEASKIETSNKLAGKTFLLTGTLSRGRTEIEKEIVSLGGKIASSVSKNLDYLLVGDKAGSKLDKARKIPTITILTEADYSNLI
jgi:DNA ligase (NAD+)